MPSESYKRVRERLTELVVRFGDGSEETYSFGSFYGRNAFQERMEEGSISGMGYMGEEGVFAASFAGIAAWEGSTVTLEFTYEAEVPLPDYCWEIESFLCFRVGEESICIYLQDRVSNSFVDSLGEKDVSAMYAAAADGVDIFARERILGNVEITTNTPADDWRFHGYYNG